MCLSDILWHRISSGRGTYQETAGLPTSCSFILLPGPRAFVFGCILTIDFVPETDFFLHSAS